MSSPIDSILGNVRAITDFNDRIVQTHRDGPWALRIDSFYDGWNDLAGHLGYDAMHYSIYDSAINCPLIILIHQREQRELLPKFHWHLRNYYSGTAFTNLALADDTVTGKPTGTPFGTLNTTPDNCISLMVVAFWNQVQRLGEKEALAL
jgi:hypothetical protein